MMFSTVYFLFESGCSFTKYGSTRPKTKYLYLQFPFFFVNEGVQYDSCKHGFKFMVRDGCVKDRKIKAFDTIYKVEIWRFKMF